MKRFLVVGLAITLLVIFASVAMAQTQATVYLGNPNVVLLSGEEMDVPVMISNVSDLYGIDARLAYNPAVVQAVSVTRGVIPQPDFVLWERFDNVAGMAYYVTTQLNPTLPVSGSGLVVTVRLRGMTDGTTPLTLTVQAANRNGVEIPVTVVSGEATVSNPQPTPTIQPTETPVPTATLKPHGHCGDTKWNAHKVLPLRSCR